MLDFSDDFNVISDALDAWSKRAYADLRSANASGASPEQRAKYARAMERAAYLAGLFASRRCEDAATILATLKADLNARGTYALVVVTSDDVRAVLEDADDAEAPRLSDEQVGDVLDRLDGFDFEWAEWVRDAHDLA